MATTRKPKTASELRSLGVPEEVIRLRFSKERVWQGPLVGVVVDGPAVVPPSAEVSREELGRKIREARRRFRPRGED